jgi:hypothetical protein
MAFSVNVSISCVVLMRGERLDERLDRKKSVHIQDKDERNKERQEAANISRRKHTKNEIL